MKQNVTVHIHLQKLAQEKGLTREDLASAAGVSSATIVRIMNGSTNFNAGTFFRLLSYLDCGFDELVSIE